MVRVNLPAGVYSKNYGPELADCNTTVWNPLGDGLSYEDFNFPIFSLHEDDDTNIIRKVWCLASGEGALMALTCCRISVLPPAVLPGSQRRHEQQRPPVPAVRHAALLPHACRQRHSDLHEAH